MSQPPPPEPPPLPGGAPDASAGGAGSSGSGSGGARSGGGAGSSGGLPSLPGQRAAPVDDVFEHYRIFRREDGSLWELGHGSMGVTYKAVDTNLDALVALKIINAQFLNKESSRQRFRREARAAASLRHRNVSSVYHLGQSGQSFFYAMEFVDGETIEATVKRDGPFPWRRALSVTLQVTRALMAAHAKNLVHRDIKPLNIMVVDEVDERDVAKLIDFGLAKSAAEEEAGEGVTNASGFLGTPLYSSPEQCEELPADIRSDIYSLGITLWFMLTGEPTFLGNLARVFQQQLHAEPPWEKLPADLPPAVRTLLESMLAKDRANRPQSPADLRAEIEACLHVAPGTLSGPGGGSGGAGESRRPPATETRPRLVVQTKPLPDPRDPLNLNKKSAPTEKPAGEGLTPPLPPGKKDGGPPPLPRPGPTPQPFVLTRRGIGIGAGVLLGLGLLIWGVRAATRHDDHRKKDDGKRDVVVTSPTPTPTATSTPEVSATPLPFKPDPGRLQAMTERARNFSKTEQWDLAAAAWDAVLAGVPDAMEARVERGTARNFIGDGARGRSDFNRAILLTPADSRESLYQGIAYLRLDQPDDARRAFDAGAKLEPRDAHDHYLLAYTHQRGGDDDLRRGVAEYSEAIRLDPGDVRSLNNRGASYGTLREHDHALQDFEAALKINPKAWLVLYARGVAYADMGQAARAIEDFNAVLLINPSDSATCNQRGLAYNALGQFQRAIEDFDAAIRLNPKGWAAYANRGYAYGSLSQYPRASQDLNEAIRLNPRAAMAFYFRGMVYDGMKQHDNAIKDLDEAIKIDPRDASFFYVRGNEYAALNQPLRAVTDYDEATRLNPKYSAAFNNRGNARHALGQLPQAIADYSEAIRLNPKNSVALYNRGNEYVKTGQVEKGIADYDESLRLEAKSSLVWNNRGFAYLKVKRYEQAIEDLNQAIKLDPKNVEAYGNRAVAEEALGRTEVAAHDRDRARMLQKTP